VYLQALVVRVDDARARRRFERYPLARIFHVLVRDRPTVADFHDVAALLVA
jgi:hypothetical protein